MEQRNDIKLIVVDLDGTLLDSHKQIDSHMELLMPKLKEKGIAFTFCSGRNMHIVQDYIKQLSIDIPYICNNGANMYQEKTCIYECSMESNDARYAFCQLKERNIPFIAYTDEAVYPIGTHPQLTKFQERLKGKSNIVENCDIETIIKYPIFKTVIIQDDQFGIREVVNDINTYCRKAHCVRSEGDIYTLTHLDATKGNTLVKLMEILHMKQHQVLVFGDNYNDVSMFQVAGCSVAMKNASDEIQRKADYLSKGNDEHGVSWFINEYII